MLKITFLTASILLLSCNAYANAHLNEKVNNLSSVVISEKETQDAIKNNEFEKIFTLYSGLDNAEKNIITFNSVIKTAEIEKKLKKNKTDIIKYSHDLLKLSVNSIFPSTLNYSPDGIIVLGAKSGLGILESRLDSAYALSLKYPDIPVVLSGKGRDPSEVESTFMSNYLIKKGVLASRIYIEDDSLDTVGNGVFSYFLISKYQKLKTKKNWLIVTNNYHSMRALFNFEKIFPEKYNFAVFLAPLLPSGMTHPDEETIFYNLVLDEIKTDSNHQFVELLKSNVYDKQKNIFYQKNITGKTCEIFTEMLYSHGLYKNNVEYYIKKYNQCN